MLMNEQKEIIQCYCLAGATPTVAELQSLLQEAIPYADETIAHDMQELLDILPQMTDEEIAEMAASTLPETEPIAGTQH